jgi:hypothetical protein
MSYGSQIGMIGLGKHTQFSALKHTQILLVKGVHSDGIGLFLLKVMALMLMVKSLSEINTALEPEPKVP